VNHEEEKGRAVVDGWMDGVEFNAPLDTV